MITKRFTFAIGLILSTWLFCSNAFAGPACSGNYLLEKTFSSGARWQLCWEHRQREGIVYHDLFYTPPGGSERRVLNQANMAQIHVPYDDNGARYHDVSDYGLGGTYLNDIQAADCPGGERRSESGKNMLCLLTKDRNHAHAVHVGAVDIHKIGQYFEIFSVSHVGAYNYIPTWRLYDDGSIEVMMGATGSLQRFRTGSQYQANGWLLNNNDRYGVSHLHNYFWRLDFDLGSNANDDVVEEIEFINQSGNQSRTKSISAFTTEAARPTAPERYRSWRIRDGANTNASGHAISYQIEPLLTGHKDVGPSYEPWTHNDFYVTVNKSCEKYASHNPEVNGCTDNLSTFVNGQSLVNADVVVWYSLSFHHIPRDEDEPKMHAHWNSFKIIPRNVTIKNPLANDSGSSNTPPVLSNPGDQTNVAGESVSLALTASDIDGDTLSYSANGLPTGLTLTNGIIAGTPTTVGNYSVTLTVSDGVAEDQKSITWTINSPGSAGCSTYTSNNVPLAISSNGTVTVTSNLNIAATGTITDINVLNLKGKHTYMSDLDFKLSSPAGTTVQIINNSCSSTNDFNLNLDDAVTEGWPCPPNTGGTYKPFNALTAFNGQDSAGNWTLSIHDRANLDGGSLDQWALEICTQIVAPTNEAPVITNPGNQNNFEGDTISLTIIATDADSDTLTYSATGLPTGLQINNTSGLISGSLPVNSASSYSVNIIVDDGQGHSPNIGFSWQVDTPNQAPVITNPGNQNNNVADVISLAIIATDADADNLAFTATGLPAGLQINTASGLISGTLAANSAGPYTVDISVDDGQGHNPSISFEWQVAIANQSPVITNPGNQNSTEGEAISLTITATDADGDTLTYSATGLPTGLQINSTSGIISGTIPLNSAGSYSVDIVVDDNNGHNPSINFNWQVYIANQAPVINNPGEQNNNIGELISLAIDASDPNNDTLTYSATALPDGLQIDSVSGIITGTLSASSQGTHAVSITVDDNQGHQVNALFNWVVNSIQTSVMVRKIITGNDDVEERADGTMYRYSSDLELVEDPSAQNVGLRFQDIALPQGTVVTKAWIQFQADETNSAPTTLQIVAEATDHATAFSSTAMNVSNRSVTTASSNWSPAPWNSVGEANTAQRTPDLSTVIQEVINRSGWESGNAMVFILTGNGKRVAESYNGNQAAAATLHIEYESTGGGNSSTTVSKSISTGNDDVEERASGSMYFGSSDLELTQDGSQQTIGLRFSDFSMPQGVTIINAWIQFQTDEVSTTATNLLIQTEAIDSAPAFSSTTNNVSNRALSQSSVPWVPVAWNTVGEASAAQRTPNLKTLLQEIADRTGWASGNSLVFVITGTGERVAESYNGSTSGAPKLVVEYQ